MEAHTIDKRIDLLAWVERQGEPLVTHKGDSYGAVILPGNPAWSSQDDYPAAGGGFTLYWHDYVVNEWAEWFPDLPTAIARLAALAYAVEANEFFAREPADFFVLAEYMFERTMTPKEGTDG